MTRDDENSFGVLRKTIWKTKCLVEQKPREGIRCVGFSRGGRLTRDDENSFEVLGRSIENTSIAIRAKKLEKKKLEKER